MFIIVIMNAIREKAGLAGFDEFAEGGKRVEVLISGVCFFRMNHYLIFVQDARPI